MESGSTQSHRVLGELGATTGLSQIRCVRFTRFRFGVGDYPLRASTFDSCELGSRNQSAAASLAEGMEKTLTLHRLGVYELLGRSFKATNCLESVNALVEERCAQVDARKTSRQRHRWLATALLDVEPGLWRVKGHEHLTKLRAALRRVLNIKNDVVREEQAA